MLDLSNLNTERYFVIGDIRGDYDQFINLLYQQKFGHKDTLITTGNITDNDKQKSADTLLFIKNVPVAYSVKGKEEFRLEALLAGKPREIPVWISSHPKIGEIKNFLAELPLIIKLPNNIYVVGAGAEPNKKVGNQDESVFYSIGEFDKESRFYKFDNPDGKSWYDFEFDSAKFCFGTFVLDKMNVPAGYALGRDSKSPIRCLIFTKDDPEPTYVEAR